MLDRIKRALGGGGATPPSDPGAETTPSAAAATAASPPQPEAAPAGPEPVPDYKTLYENHAAQCPDDTVIGDGDFEVVGRNELNLLKEFGLKPGHNLLDLGCGVGRLAVHAIPYLGTGKYYGIELSEDILNRARTKLAHLTEPGRVFWHVEVDPPMPCVPAEECDFMCAFSVYTHMDPEDVYVNLREIKRVAKPGGKYLCSLLLLPESEAAKEIFKHGAALPYQMRRGRVINAATSRDFFGAIAEMAGWEIEAWKRHDDPIAADEPQWRRAFGHAVCVLRKPG